MAGTGIDGYDDGEDLLGWGDDVALLGWTGPLIPGSIDPSDLPLGGPVSDRVYTLTATLYPNWDSQSAPITDAATPAIANHPISGFPFGAGVAGPGPAILRFASRDFTTADDDTLAPSTFFDGRVNDPGSIGFSLPLVPVGAAAIETKAGSVTIDNTDGVFDTILDQNAAISQALLIQGGRTRFDTGRFVTLFNGRITGIGMTETEVTIELQDPVLYAQNHYPTSIYTGLGAAAGDPELEGAVKPVVLGRVWNMSPVLINAVSLIYQAHDGPISSVSGVYDGGVPLTFAANYGSYSALAAATVAAGRYATCIAEGLIRVGGTPAFALTADVDGSSLAGNTIPSIATYLLNQLRSQLGIEINADSLSVLPGWIAGWVWTEPFTLAEAISRFIGDGGCHWGADAAGTVRVLQLTPPDPNAIAATYDVNDIDQIERAPLPGGYEAIHQRRQVQYRRNWTVQGDSSLAATASARAGRQREWRTSLVTVPVSARNAIDPDVLETSLYSVGNAESLGSYLLRLHGTSRQMFSLETRIFGTLPKIGETVAVDYPRFGLAGGAVFRVVAVDMRLADGALNLLLWG